MVSEADLDRAAAILRNGGLVGLPTETVYGLAANALDAEAVVRIYKVKGRPATSPLIVHVAAIEMARGLAREWPLEANILAGAYWPGPLTMVVPKREIVPDVVTAGLNTVGLRMPAHPVALEVIRRAGVPLAAPSANRFTQLSPTTAQHVRDSLGDAVDLVLDGGPCEVGIESTVISLPEPMTLLRAGHIGKEKMEALLGRPLALAGEVSGAHPAPGMHAKHYSPRTPLVLLRGGELPPGRGICLRLPADPVECARALYGLLHEADARNADWIAVEEPPDTPEWAAVRDRLQRAAAR